MTTPSNHSTILFASAPSPRLESEFTSRAVKLIQDRFNLDTKTDPRLPINNGHLVALILGYELDAQKRSELDTPAGKLEVFAVGARKGDAQWTYLGNEVRLGDRVVAQRWRSIGGSHVWKKLSGKPIAGNIQEANQFLAIWRDASVVTVEAAKKMVVLALDSDIPHGMANCLSRYARANPVKGMTGYVDLRPALKELCAGLDRIDAAAKAKADAEELAKAEALAVVQVGAPVAELRKQVKALGLTGLGKAKKAELEAAIAAAASPEPTEILVGAEEMKLIATAMNTVNLDQGQSRLRAALKNAGIAVPVVEGAPAGSWVERAMARARLCRVGTVAAADEDTLVLEHDEVATVVVGA